MKRLFVASATIASLLVAGCTDSFSPRRGLSADAANQSRTNDRGNAAKSGAIDARLVLDAAQHATLSVRTGRVDDATGAVVSDGVFKSLQYKLYDGANKLVAARNVQFSTPEPATYSVAVDARTGWTVSVQANVIRVDDDGTKTDVVRADAAATMLPDVSAAAPLIRGTDGTTTPLSGATATPGESVTIIVPLANGETTSLIEQVACDVAIDGAPANVSFSNGTPNVTVAPGATAACEFATSFTAGTHTISVTARPLTWPDLDPSNNAVSATLTVRAPEVTTAPPVSIGDNGVYEQVQLSPTALYGGPLPPNVTYTFRSSDPTIAEVDATGLVTPRGDGTTTITFAVTTTVGGQPTTVLIPITVELPSPAVCQVHAPPNLAPHALNIFLAGEPARTLSVQNLPSGAEVGWAVGNEAANVGGGAHVVALQTTATTATITPIAGGTATLTFTENVSSQQVAEGTGCLVVIGGGASGPQPATLGLPATATLTIQPDGSTTPLQLSATLLDGTGAVIPASTYDVAWSSGAPNVVSVTSSGVITALEASTLPVTITARVGLLSATTVVTVVDLRTPPPPPATFSVSPAAPACQVGGQVTLTANVPAGTTVTWVLPSSSLAFADAPVAVSEVGTAVTLNCLGPARASGTPVPVTVTANLNSQNTTESITVIMTP